VAIEPAPARKNGPPVWIGGRPARDGGLSASSQRTALLSDGWMPYMVTPEMYRAGIAAIRGRAAEIGRDPASISPSILLMVTIAESRDAARRIAIAEHLAVYKQDFSAIIDKYDVFGTPEDCIRGIERYVEAGARDIILNWRCPPLATRDNITLAAKKILPYFR
jgi:alkanesulfonate monooxygenase SsuD/methylene tetrahydromethanopterin reductase-like flavin-dependent oxidoreductase (luciferase family)